MYKLFLKRIFFLLSPEEAHHVTMTMMKWKLVCWMMKGFLQYENPKLEKEVMGLKFKNPIGMAAGFDKNGTYIRELEALGFGYVEVGTVTPMPQPGNDKPRLFRLPKDEALINRMGFNNVGADVLAARLKEVRTKTKIIIGGNIGKNKTTPNEKAIDDYVICFEKLFDVVDYFVVNVSSPNTPNLRELQDKKPLTEILSKLQELNFKHEKPKPILLKIAPDLSNTQLDEIIEIIFQTEIAGVVATNTTISRADLISSKTEIENCGAGGLSGKPIANRATEVIKYIAEKSEGKFVIIGVGGIQTPDDAAEKINAGADLIQLYTGMIYEGPSIVRKMKRKLVN